MSTLKERLASAPDVTEKTFKVDDIGEIKIRRMTVRERDLILKDHKAMGGGSDAVSGSILGQKVVVVGLVDPTTTEEEISEMPAFIIDKIAKIIMDFNGWTVQGRGSLEDQFRTAT